MIILCCDKLAKPTHMLKETGHRDNDVAGYMDMEVQTFRNGEMRQGGGKHREMAEKDVGTSWRNT